MKERKHLDKFKIIHIDQKQRQKTKNNITESTNKKPIPCANGSCTILQKVEPYFPPEINGAIRCKFN